MEIVTCAKSTQLYSFPDFNELSTHSHSGEGADFSFFKPNALVQVNKNWGCELLGIKTVDAEKKIVPLRKLKVDNIQCIASPKFGKGAYFAIGLATGHIKLIDLKSFELQHRFNPDLVDNSISFLDFSSCNEYLSGVYENGMINIYGLKTRNKLQTITLDGHCTLARYHPVKRYHLAVASYSGALTVYDTNAKKNYFQKLNCHAAPLKDVCMSAQHPDIVATVGFDSKINIFDTRARSTMFCIESKHPFSTIAMADCGNYLAVGNLKGEIIGYDFRQLDTVLNVKQLDQSAITRIAFVPSTSGVEKASEETRISLYVNEEPPLLTSPVTSLSTNRVSLANKRDSFIDFLGFMDKKPNHNEYMSRVSIGGVDSHLNSRLSTGSRLSCGIRLSQEWRQHHERFDDELNVETETEKETEQLNMSNINTERLRRRKKEHNITVGDGVTADKKISNTRLSLQNQMVSELSQIAEVDDKENSSDSQNITSKSVENAQTSQESFAPLTSKNHSHVARRSYESSTSHLIAANGQDLSKVLREEIQTAKTEILTQVRQELSAGMHEEFDKFEKSMAFDIERHKYHTFSIIYNTNRILQKQTDKMQEDLDTIKSGVSLLMRDDPFVQAYVQMHNENYDLRQRLAQYEN